MRSRNSGWAYDELLLVPFDAKKGASIMGHRTALTGMVMFTGMIKCKLNMIYFKFNLKTLALSL